MRQLLEQYVPRVYRFSLRLTRGDTHAAEELTQETMLRAWRHRRRLGDARTARPWLFKITLNVWRDHLRRLKTRREGQLKLAARGAAAPPHESAVQREQLAGALQALDGLPSRQRQVLYLSACAGLTIAQIGGVLGVSSGAVKASLSLARQRIRAVLAAHGVNEPCGKQR